MYTAITSQTREMERRIVELEKEVDNKQKLLNLALDGISHAKKVAEQIFRDSYRMKFYSNSKNGIQDFNQKDEDEKWQQFKTENKI